MKRSFFSVALVLIALLTKAQTISTFDTLPLTTDTFWNGTLTSTGFADGEAFFPNSFDTSSYGGVVYDLWSGFAYSNMFYPDTSIHSDSVLTNAMQYSAITGSGYGGNGNYAVAYIDSSIKVNLTGNAVGGIVNGFYATNTAYAWLSMKYGDDFEPAFSYSNKDSFVLKITGWYNGSPIGDTISFYLADFRDSIFLAADTTIVPADTTIVAGDTTISAADTAIYPGDTLLSPGIITSWQWVDLRSLGNVDSLTFSFVSSQTGQYGINTPTYFAMDNFTTGDMVDNYITINYEQDTLIGIWPFMRDSSVLPAPYTVSVISGPEIAGASATVINDSIWYIPSIGIVSTDTVTYAVCGANSQCVEAQVFITVTGLSGVRDINTNTIEASVFPNPFSNSFKVNYSGNLEEIRLYDLQGRLLKVVQGGEWANETEIDAADLAEGPYLARIITDQGTAAAKIVKQ